MSAPFTSVVGAGSAAETEWSAPFSSMIGAGAVPPAELPESICPDSIEQLKDELKAPLKTLLAPSYQRQTITEQAKSGQDSPRRQVTGKGTSWGSAVHRALERLALEPAIVNDDDRLLAILEVEERPAEELAELRATLQQVMAQPIWQRMQHAEAILTEVPFGIRQGDTYISGVIDLIFREESGWVIVDYKSDTIIDEAHRQELLSYYQPQVDAYQQYWQNITGENVAEATILFV